MIEDKQVGRAKRFLAAAKALMPTVDDRPVSMTGMLLDEREGVVALRPEFRADGVHLKYYGLDWGGATIDACLDQAEAWLRECATQRVREKREEMDVALARQRDVEMALDAREVVSLP